MSASGVSRITCESGPCSACDSRSEATKSGVAPLSAITSTSDGPAGISMAAPSRRWLTWRLASVTKALPGQRFYRLSAPIRCQSQSRNRLRAPHFKDFLYTAELRRIENFIGNRRRGAEHHFLQPAMRAGVASISTVENSGAEPPGYTARRRR
jgi:hypothetical protein